MSDLFSFVPDSLTTQSKMFERYFVFMVATRKTLRNTRENKPVVAYYLPSSGSLHRWNEK
jgi:hypothetical protein